MKIRDVKRKKGMKNRKIICGKREKTGGERRKRMMKNGGE